MKQRDHIQSELRELSPVLAQIPFINVYKVPEGYFEAMPIQFLMAACPPVTLTLGSAVPDDYFTNLPSIILGKIKLGEVFLETNNISAEVARIGNKNIFTVPAGYFERLPATLSASIDSSETIAGSGKENVYKVPPGYFDSLSTDILARINNNVASNIAKETKAISELVGSIGNKNVYNVPQEYFDNLAGNLLKTAHSTTAKVVNMKSRFNLVKYAAAAVVTGIIGFSLFFMLNKNEPAKSAATTATMAAAEKIIETNSFEKELNTITDQAIVNFLESKGENVEAALVASLVDEKNLPDITDYLIDDKTLDEILRTVELSN